MKRYHLFEFEDLPWFPTALRDNITDFLQFMVNHFDFYKGLVPVLQHGVEASGANTIIDLASGGGGGWPRLLDHLREVQPDVAVVLTDRYPNREAFEALEASHNGAIRPYYTPVSALDVPPDLVGLRTQFLSLHHFCPDEVRQILQNAVDARAPFLAVEIQDRSWASVAKHMLSPLSVLLTTPFIRPFRWSRLLFTYLVPILPIIIWWDGLVSVLRTHSKDELQALIEDLDGTATFTWEIGVERSGIAPVYYLLGLPTEDPTTQK